ncbi:hypothetical protein NLO98_08800 [Pseudomonas syringae]|nr:hypothetical protein [Pseudomonas syringae]
MPAIPPFVRQNCIALPRPDLAQVAKAESSLCEIMEARCSDRNFGSVPLTSEQIGDLLYRSGRLKEVSRKSGSEIAYYPYPGGGARSELAIYLVLSEGQGYPASLYRYEASTHSLLSINEMTPEVEQLLRDAQVTLNAEFSPPLLLIFAARFRRVSYKYEGKRSAITPCLWVSA